MYENRILLLYTNYIRLSVIVFDFWLLVTIENLSIDCGY
jgi:hypothetical protein